MGIISAITSGRSWVLGVNMRSAVHFLGSLTPERSWPESPSAHSWSRQICDTKCLSEIVRHISILRKTSAQSAQSDHFRRVNVASKKAFAGRMMWLKAGSLLHVTESGQSLFGSRVLMWQSCGIGVHQLSSLKVMHGNLLFQDSQKTFLDCFGICRPTDRPVISATPDPKDHRVFVFLLLSSIFPSSFTCFLFISGIFTRSVPLGKRCRALRTFHGCVRVACNTIEHPGFSSDKSLNSHWMSRFE